MLGKRRALILLVIGAFLCPLLLATCGGGVVAPAAWEE